MESFKEGPCQRYADKGVHNFNFGEGKFQGKYQVLNIREGGKSYDSLVGLNSHVSITRQWCLEKTGTYPTAVIWNVNAQQR